MKYSYHRLYIYGKKAINQIVVVIDAILVDIFSCPIGQQSSPGKRKTIVSNLKYCKYLILIRSNRTKDEPCDSITTYTQTLNKVDVFLPQMITVTSNVSGAVVSDRKFMFWILIHIVRKRIPIAGPFS